jgi:hypothetical protein
LPLARGQSAGLAGRDNDGDGRADLLWELALGSAVRANLIVRYDYSAIYAGTVNGNLVAISNAGAKVW